MTQKKSEHELAQIDAEQKLERGKSHFHAGNYNQAETDLIGATTWHATSGTQLVALKYLAFTYCVTDRATLCRHAFNKALQLDPRFELSEAEVTHPLWGPQFKLARNGTTTE
ncbi:TssQ family T6SS-associated lipoprotein [Gilvimarinus japonicus]|uniref:TssQ family T6SS-associated lipoprotein n=1 Tax=Gilvimarinus japonicus TaxID=1796469 RepID=A0ABV7HMK6_9GAMM